MLDEVNMAKNMARIMSKTAEQAFKSSTGKQEKLIDKADIIHNLQDQLASISNEHKRYVDKQERRFVELDMEKSETIAELENDCNEAVEELHVSTSLDTDILFFVCCVAQFFSLNHLLTN